MLSPQSTEFHRWKKSVGKKKSNWYRVVMSHVWNLSPFPSVAHSLIKSINCVFLVRTEAVIFLLLYRKALYSALKWSKDFSVCKISHRWRGLLGQQLRINSLISDQVYELWKIPKKKGDNGQKSKEVWEYKVAHIFKSQSLLT